MISHTAICAPTTGNDPIKPVRVFPKMRDRSARFVIELTGRTSCPRGSVKGTRMKKLIALTLAALLPAAPDAAAQALLSVSGAKSGD
jgi:hypothetical protein